SDGGARATADGQRTEDPDRREQGRDRSRREPPAEPVDRAVASRLLVLLDDLGLAVLALLDHGGVEVVGCFHLVVERLDRLVVDDRLVDTVVGRGGYEQGVWLIGHRGLLIAGLARRVSRLRGRPPHPIQGMAPRGRIGLRSRRGPANVPAAATACGTPGAGAGRAGP